MVATVDGDIGELEPPKITGRRTLVVLLALAVFGTALAGVGLLRSASDLSSGPHVVMGTFSYLFMNSLVASACPGMNQTVFADNMLLTESGCSSAVSTTYDYRSDHENLPPLFLDDHDVQDFLGGTDAHSTASTSTGIFANWTYAYTVNGIPITAHLNGFYVSSDGAYVLSNGTREWYGETDTWSLLNYSLDLSVILERRAARDAVPLDVALLIAGCVVAPPSFVVLLRRPHSCESGSH